MHEILNLFFSGMKEIISVKIIIDDTHVLETL